jgi:transposase-like protein
MKKKKSMQTKKHANMADPKDKIMFARMQTKCPLCKGVAVLYNFAAITHKPSFRCEMCNRIFNKG